VPILFHTLQQFLEVVSERLEVLTEALQLVRVAEEEVAAGHVLDDSVAPLQVQKKESIGLWLRLHYG